MIDELMRLLPDFRGKRRLARILFRNYISKGVDITIKGKLGCTYLLPNIKESISFDLYSNGIYERETNSFLLDSIPKNGVFLDLGANIGSITIPLLRKRPDIKCICVEAAPWIYAYLEKNIALNFPPGMITTINKALLDKSGEILPFYSPADQFGKGSLTAAFTKEAVNVTTITIDDLVNQLHLHRVDMIKIDIEGYEYYAFKGATSLLNRNDAPDILFEFVDWAEDQAGLDKGASQQFLRDMGYMLYCFTGDIMLVNYEGVIRSGSEMLLASKRNLNS